VPVLKISGALPSYTYMLSFNFYHVSWLEINGALTIHHYTYALKFLSRGWVENNLSSTFTPQNECFEINITWLGWEKVELYLHSPTCVHWTCYHLAGLKICGSLPSLRYMCALNFLSSGWVQNKFTSTFATLYVCIEFLSRGWVENRWSSTLTPILMCIELITWLGWDYVNLYLHSPACVH